MADELSELIMVVSFDVKACRFCLGTLAIKFGGVFYSQGHLVRQFSPCSLVQAHGDVSAS